MLLNEKKVNFSVILYTHIPYVQCMYKSVSYNLLILYYRQLISGASIHLIYGRRYGFVGRNGLGKTTLLKMISK